ncbi:HEAT repeat domain-containing protein [Halapricum desulfuricans]|uniref:HEAT repeats containing protein n=1 Tax=Halapricum desulfuricans TaxID=2841257 RepID=A0A897N6U8_9EURY|nr:HEAT repeat domain-containing protein [Halapricum desulfuricans]QSG08447.1 HEAT repeats containing protein [Halapricum desulfuricans]
MSNGDEPDDGEAALTDLEDFESRLDSVAESLEAAGTETDLDDVEATLDATAEALEAADLPEPDDEDEDDPSAELEGRIDGLREDLNAQRGPYLEDVTDDLESVVSTVEGTRWTETGSAELDDAVASFLAEIDDEIDSTVEDGEPADRLDAAVEALSELDLDPDEDTETIEALLTAVDGLEDDIDAAESWDDLTVREQLTAEGFYEVLGPEGRRDYPPEWNAVKIYEKRYQQDRSDGEAIEMILLALEKLPGGKDHFMEENILDSLARIAPPEALEDVLPMAGKRNEKAIRVVGKIGDPGALDTLLDFIDGDGDRSLQLETLRAVGAIGSEAATRTVADRLAAEDAEIRSAAARALGRIGDTRAIEPLADVLADDPEASVRASAAWALVQIGTERAFEAVETNADDSYLVQVEAEKAALSS